MRPRLDLRKRLAFLFPARFAAHALHTLYELRHYFPARLLGVKALELRFLTNGLLTSQVVYAIRVAERVGAHWLVSAWIPAVLHSGRIQPLGVSILGWRNP